MATTRHAECMLQDAPEMHEHGLAAWGIQRSRGSDQYSTTIWAQRKSCARAKGQLEVKLHGLGTLGQKLPEQAHLTSRQVARC